MKKLQGEFLMYIIFYDSLQSNISSYNAKFVKKKRNHADQWGKGTYALSNNKIAKLKSCHYFLEFIFTY